MFIFVGFTLFRTFLPICDTKDTFRGAHLCQGHAHWGRVFHLTSHLLQARSHTQSCSKLFRSDLKARCMFHKEFVKEFRCQVPCVYGFHL